MKRSLEDNTGHEAKCVRLTYELDENTEQVQADIDALLEKIYARHDHSVELCGLLNGLCIPKRLETKNSNMIALWWEKIEISSVKYAFYGDGLRAVSINSNIKEITKLKPSKCRKSLARFHKIVVNTNMGLGKLYDLMLSMHRKLRTPVGVVPSILSIRLPIDPPVAPSLNFYQAKFCDRISLFISHLDAIGSTFAQLYEWVPLADLYPIPESTGIKSICYERVLECVEKEGGKVVKNFYIGRICAETDDYFLQKISGENAGKYWFLSEDPDQPDNHPKAALLMDEISKQGGSVIEHSVEINWKTAFSAETEQ